MNTLFVNMKSQLTFSKELLETVGFEVYRTRTECKCTPGQDRRDAIIGIMEYDEAVMVKVIRCRGCVNRKEAGNV